MNAKAYDVTGGDDVRFSSAVDLSPVGDNIAHRLKGAGFRPQESTKDPILAKDAGPVDYIVIPGTEKVPGSYKGKVRSPNGVDPEEHVRALVDELSGILEPYQQD